ncbi:ribose/proton symporter RbsU [Enterococcus cecorum]|uniref:Ribose uptake protein n=1 Tax=Enterococcus cecorum DSM 20682 = ATCC 43198 TaxID=1121864 RepID=S1R430_9ENTE|nr:GRP family sugar transporter [Enterococcus cecorum]EOX17574.1 ribose uptake protein [Enterococcus cecorum DSM 20682 = ATCC 43198]ESK60362.1 ribose uptake protein [Enterococcus cecorum DSM 20682 = ATCC 43198]OJG33437.1 ribose uptake protein [Enterococcus cecorum DSM 20682 = ATCC 43198]CAI3393397.1 ribose uptake protein [Enterococcus cecorum DSM 20682 = ATCC 43198]SQE54337.1 ribose uptake protein [Enterococcus cecorum]
MNTVALLVGLGPLIGWGIFPTIASKFGGRPSNQILGATLGTLIFALIFNMTQGIALPTGHDLLFAILSGIGWASAQILTFYSFTLIGSSRAMPITTAFQLLGASLWGVIALGDWPSAMDKIIGALALVLIILGAWMTVWSEHKNTEHQAHLQKAVLILAVGEIGYWAYSAAPQATDLTGMQAFLPQAIGMVLVAVVYDFYNHFKSNEPLALQEAVSYKQIFSGFFFAFAALTYLISAQPDMNGLATGFILSQTSVILATLTGIYFLKQAKTKKEMTVTILGLVLIIFAASLTVIV